MLRKLPRYTVVLRDACVVLRQRYVFIPAADDVMLQRTMGDKFKGMFGGIIKFFSNDPVKMGGAAGERESCESCGEGPSWLRQRIRRRGQL